MSKKAKDFIRKTATRISPRFNTELMHLLVKKKKVNLKNPVTFDDKISWLKLYDYPNRKLTSICADKYKVREYVAEKGYSHILIPLYGVYESAQDIDFNELPNSFVLKWNNDSASVVIVKNKEEAELDKVVKKLTDLKDETFYLRHADFHYKQIKPRIICEQMLTPSNGELNDYKMYTYNGTVKYIMACVGRSVGRPKFYFFDRDWNLQRINKDSKAAKEGFTLPKPEKLEEAIEAAEALTQGFPFVRADFYIYDDKLYFGELTFVPAGGCDPGLTKELDLLLGKDINIRGEK